MASEMQQPWTEQQLKHINFVARGKTNKKGEKRTDEEFAEAIGVDRVTLWRWMQLPGYRQAIIDAKLADRMGDIAEAIDAHAAKAKGADVYMMVKDRNGNKKKKKLNPDVQSFREITKLTGITVNHKVDADVKSEVKGEHVVTHRFDGLSDEQLLAIANGEA